MNEFVITATRSMRKYAARVVGDLTKFPSFSAHADSINRVEALKTDRFADGEMEVAVTESLRGKDVILFTSCARNEADIGVEEAKIELYHTIDALKRSQAERITVFEPFVSCSRSDRTTRRSSVGLWVHFKILSTMGTNHIVTYQLHSDKSKSMLDPTVCLIDDIPALTLLKKYLCDTYIRDLKTLEEEVRPNWAFCSVDAGGEKLTRQFANAFMAPLVVAHKQRDYSKSNTIESINILSAEPIAGKVLWVVDDMIDTAGSVVSLIRALAPFKPAEINIISTHALFSPPAGERLSQLSAEGLLNRIIVTDTVHCACAATLNIPNLVVVPSAGLSAKVVRTIVTNTSVNQLMKPFNAEAYFKEPYLFNQN
ncbi:ribose-phosphate diphosphokinase [Treponema primitia]|uniref:ribose-phosphate diphosphokinase n=1 Tax=Treponema primitia TaxID=88058 RepID=UPI00025558E0|nr:ribose-phosphate diphosphokinase [Treponema primitia]